jgi:hypothetical protein
MNADSAYVIGATHAVCQDYAAAGNPRPNSHAPYAIFPAAPYVILSDGCSSSPDSDIGARFLVRAAEQTLFAPSTSAAASDLAEVHKEAARRSLMWAELTGLHPHTVDATLLSAHLSGDDLVLGCSGDGVIVLQSRTGVIDVYDISYPSGYPIYPCYAHQPERLLALEGDGRAIKVVKHFRCSSVEEPLRLEDASSSASITEVFTVNARDYKHAALLSDGIHSFFTTRQTETSRSVEAIPMEEILRELISFKSVGGAFVRRRIKKFAKDCQTNGWQHADDLAFGALHMED